MESLKQLITQIKQKRNDLGLTQAELATAANVSQSYIAKLEAGLIDPSYTQMDKIIDALKNANSDTEKTAETLMTPDITTADPDQSLGDAVTTMKKHGFSQLPVTTNQRCIGSLTESRLFQHSKGDQSYEQPVKDVMDDPFPTVSPHTPRTDIAALLHHHAAVLVIDHTGIRGIITKTDLL